MPNGGEIEALMITDLHVRRLFIALGALAVAAAPLLKPVLA